MGRDFQIRHKYKHYRLCYQSELHFDSSFIPPPLLIWYVKKRTKALEEEETDVA